MNTFKASMDSLTKGLTIVVSVILVLSGFVPIFTSEFQFSNISTPAPFYVMPFAFIIMLLVTYGFSPKGYSLQDGQLVIYRPFRNKFYGTESIQTVSIVAKEELKWSMRVFGVGGLFGYFGLFRNSRYGTMIWYASRRDQFVVIERSNGKTIVLTPDDPNSFVSEWNETKSR
jgi:cytochrome c biogenesis factor